MSHFTSIETQIKDIEALRSACAEMGLSLLENTTARGFGGNTNHGDYVIRLRGPYDIALNRRTTGQYDLATDWWQDHVAQEVGANFGRLLQIYGVHKTLREARRLGFRVRRQEQKDGTIKLTLQGD